MAESGRSILHFSGHFDVRFQEKRSFHDHPMQADKYQSFLSGLLSGFLGRFICRDRRPAGNPLATVHLEAL